MASDAAVANAVDDSVLSDAELNNAVGSDPHNDALSRATLNGSPSVDEIANKHITNVEDQLNSADVSVSGGSDTEASKGDSTTKSKDGDKGHLRTPSTAKKPATFKAVSVNKTFLASKGAAAINAASKPADKSTPNSTLSSTSTGASALSATRPRLVAKSGNGTGSSPKFSSVINGAKASASPDPNAVWNKNRPVPAPDPKKLSDEELKKYGIHMASRLGPETNQNHDNWADIEEDDDDWAPDTITWTDGTKVTLPQPGEEDPEPPREQTPVIARDMARPPEKSKSPAPPALPAPLAPSASHEKPSNSPKPGVMTSGKGLVLKGGPTEKPTVSTNTAPTLNSSKSPWAKLAPVDKVAPLGTDSTPQAHSHLPVRDQHVQSVSPPPAREIAADDFNRSTWRDGPTAGSRELFNSQSGRYEPVGDRRGSMRSDAHHRQTAVLQRSSQSDHPEPSAAFQTSRNTHEGHFGRRRGSSNLSGGAYPPLRPSFGAHDPPSNFRRESITASTESPVSPQARHISPEGLHGGPRHYGNQQRQQPHASPSTNHASPQHAAAPAPASVDPVQLQQAQEQKVAEEYELQKKIMHEKREAAMQRRREQEAREEAERKKRIQAKLDAMGPAPERKSAKKETSNEASVPQVPVQIQQRQAQDQTSHAADPAPISTQDGTPSEQSARDHPDGSKSPLPPHLHARQEAEPTGDLAESMTGPLPPHLAARQDAKASWGPPATSQPERFSSWGTSSQQLPSNVWAPNDSRGLGNGTFITSLGRTPVSPHLAPSQPSKGPAPIAPPSAQRASTTQASPGSNGDNRKREISGRWGNAVLDSDRAIMEQNRVRLAEQERQLAERGMSLADSIPDIKDTWRPTNQHASLSNAPDVSSRAGPSAASARRDFASQGRVTPPHAAGLGGAPASILPTTSSGPQARPSRFFPTRDARQEQTALVEPEKPRSPSPPPPDTTSHPAFDGDSRRPHVSLPPPQPVVRVPPPATPGASSGPASRSGAPFSWANPLPFRDSAGPSSVPAGRGRGAGHEWERSSARAPGHNAPQGKDWNERFRSLFSDQHPPAASKVISPPSASVVDASSKSTLDNSGHGKAATVSLPRQHPEQVKRDAAHFSQAATAARRYFADQLVSFTVKPSSEECFEAQEMGSLPAVRVPREAPDALWHPASPPPKDRSGPRRFVNADITSMPQLWIPHDTSASGAPEYHILLPGMNAPKAVAGPALRSRSNPRRGGSGRGPRGGRGGKNGDASPPSPSGDGPPSRPHGRGGRGRYRGRGSDWTRRPSTAS